MVEDIKKAIENNNFSLAASISQKYLEDTNNIPLNIAVTGESGVGKSTSTPSCDSNVQWIIHIFQTLLDH